MSFLTRESSMIAISQNTLWHTRSACNIYLYLNLAYLPVLRRDGGGQVVFSNTL